MGSTSRRTCSRYVQCILSFLILYHFSRYRDSHNIVISVLMISWYPFSRYRDILSHDIVICFLTISWYSFSWYHMSSGFSWYGVIFWHRKRRLYQTCFWCIDMKVDMMSIGTGKMMVLLFSAEMLFKVCRYLSWKQKHDMQLKLGWCLSVSVWLCLSVCLSVCRIPSKDMSTTWSAAGESAITSAACRRALLALCSPSAAITWKDNLKTFIKYDKPKVRVRTLEVRVSKL